MLFGTEEKVWFLGIIVIGFGKVVVRSFGKVVVRSSGMWCRVIAVFVAVVWSSWFGI